METSTVKITVIGSGDAFGSGGRLNTCFHVNTGNAQFLIDCGASTLPGLKKYGINTDEIDAIVISHFHGDHYGGIPFLLLEASLSQTKKNIDIISPPGGKQRLISLLELLYPGSPVLEKLNISFIEYAPNEAIERRGFTVTGFPVVHVEEALPHGLRIETSGKVIAYSGDTSWTDALIPLSNLADVFICECNFYSTQAKEHLCYQELESHLPEFTCKKLFLTHPSDEILEKRHLLDIRFLYDGMKICL